jgi:hypothetical protein
MDAEKGRAIQLGFKRSTTGLSPEEEKELKDLNQKFAIDNRVQSMEEKQQQRTR